MNTFSLKTKVYTGPGSLDALKGLSARSAFLVCDPFMVHSKMADLVSGPLGERGISCRVFSEVVPDPTVQAVAKGVKAIMEAPPDLVVALGGGSAIDTAKAVLKIYTGGGKERPLFVAIPTTSGTGSEVTAFSVVSDPEKAVKYPLVDEEMLPDIAILDPMLTLSVPAAVTADTGMDVFTHALEAYVSPQATDFTDALAQKAIVLTCQNLPQLYRDGKDERRRERLHNASCMAGIAFNEAGLGLNHSMAHALGGRFHIPHGRSNALLLPHVIAYNAGLMGNEGDESLRARERYAEVAQMLSLPAANPRVGAYNLIGKVRGLLETLSFPKGIAGTGLERREFEEALPGLSRAALEDRCTGANPVPVTLEQIEAIYRRAYLGQ